MELLGFQVGNANAHSVSPWSHHRTVRTREEVSADRRKLNAATLPFEDQDKNLMLTALSL